MGVSMRPVPLARGEGAARGLRGARLLVLLGLLALLGACSGTKPRPVDDARVPVARADGAPDAPPVTADATDAADAASATAPAPVTGDVEVRVEWRDVPVLRRASPGRTACGTPRAAAVAPTTTWGIPDVVVIVDGMRADDAEPGRVVLADCALAPRVVTGAVVHLASALDRPARVTLVKRGTVATLATIRARGRGTPRAIQLPIAGHAVELALDAGGVYELQTDGKAPETAWVVAAPAAITGASGQIIVRDLAPGAHAVTAWLPPRAGAPAKLARGTVTVEAGELATITLDLTAP